MKQAIFCLLLGVFLVSAGCDIRRGFQPPPPAYELWQKAGASQLDVKKKLMECGMPDPFGIVGYAELSTNDHAMIYFCMERAGYGERGPGSAGMCYNHREKNLPVCQPGATISAPSVRKRLNSRYCMKTNNREGPACQP